MLAIQMIACVLLGQPLTEPVEIGSLVSQLGIRSVRGAGGGIAGTGGLGGQALPAPGPRDRHATRRSATGPRGWCGDRELLLTRATRVRLDYDRAPLTEVVQSLGEQAGFRVTLYPDNLRKWKYQKVTLSGPRRSPSGRRSTCLRCREAPAQSRDLHGIGGPREPTFALIDGASTAITPSCDHGPFRVSLLGDPLPARPQLTWHPRDAGRPGCNWGSPVAAERSRGIFPGPGSTR